MSIKPPTSGLQAALQARQMEDLLLQGVASITFTKTRAAASDIK